MAQYGVYTVRRPSLNERPGGVIALLANKPGMRLTHRAVDVMREPRTCAVAIPLVILLLAFQASARADDMAYMVTAASQFGIIDLTTGVFRVLGNTRTPPFGLGRTPDGKLYTSDSSSTVYQVNPANGNLTIVGHNGVANYGLCSTTGGLYALDTSLNLYSINASTGAAMKIGPTGVNPNIGVVATAGCSAGSDSLYLTYGPSYGPGTL
jgi:hypothetical protein